MRFLPFFQRATELIGLCAGLENVRSICDAVQQRLAQANIGKHLSPFRKGQIRCQDHRGALGSVRDDLKEQFGSEVRHRDVAYFVNGNQFVSEPSGQNPAEMVVVLGFDPLVDQAGGRREADTLFLPASSHAEPRGSGADRIVRAIRLGVRCGDAAYAAMT